MRNFENTILNDMSVNAKMGKGTSVPGKLIDVYSANSVYTNKRGTVINI